MWQAGAFSIRHFALRIGFETVQGRLEACPTELLLLELPRAGFVRGGKVAGDFLGHLAGGSPLSAPLQRGDEADALLGVLAVPHGGMEDSPFAIADGEDHRLVAI